jgi:glycosyltransferase involved in cell wall biosynthesis
MIIGDMPNVSLTLPLVQRVSVGSEETGAHSHHPLRTLFVITSMPVGGAETLLVNMLDRFDSQRISAEVVCLKSPGPLGESISDRHTVHSGFLSKKWDLRVLPRLTSVMRRRQIDAVVTIGAGDKMFWGRLAAKCAGVPVICSALHSTGWPDGVGRMNRWLTPITDGFIAVADHHGTHLAKYENFPESRVHIIRNGIDCQRFVPSAQSRSELRAELRLPDDARLVGIVAALRPEKNHAMFVEVAAAVCQGDPKAHFVIVGDGPERESIRHAIELHGITDRVHLLGTRHDTPAIVAGLDLFLLCSHNEASPVSILEALACRVPVISTQVGSVAESVRDGETGFLVAPGDTMAMIQRSRQLLADTKLRSRLGENGRILVLQTGSLDSMVNGYTNLIETLYEQKLTAQAG